MSWRDILGGFSPVLSLSQNTLYTQKIAATRDSANSAHNANTCPLEHSSKILESLELVCRELEISPLEVEGELSLEEKDALLTGNILREDVATIARGVAEKKEIANGTRPAGFNERATCLRCGPIWSKNHGKFTNCPWCINRLKGIPIPRPVYVTCSDCIHFERIDHPNLGHCGKYEPEPIAGLWDSDPRYCLFFIPE